MLFHGLSAPHFSIIPAKINKIPKTKDFKLSFIFFSINSKPMVYSMKNKPIVKKIILFILIHFEEICNRLC